jgi:hypothetical protein
MAVESNRFGTTKIDRRRWVISRLMTILVGTLTAIGEFAYSSLWGRQQARFIRQILSQTPSIPNRRIIASLSTMPDRINNLEPTLRSLLEQTRPPDEIVLVVPQFSVRQQKEYVIPGYLEKIPRLRILRCEKDWGPATTELIHKTQSKRICTTRHGYQKPPFVFAAPSCRRISFGFCPNFFAPIKFASRSVLR